MVRPESVTHVGAVDLVFRAGVGRLEECDAPNWMNLCTGSGLLVSTLVAILLVMCDGSTIRAR